MKGRDRNKLCYCGSKLKFKKCHYLKDGGYNMKAGPSLSSFIQDRTLVYNYGEQEKHMSGMPKVSQRIGA